MTTLNGIEENGAKGTGGENGFSHALAQQGDRPPAGSNTSDAQDYRENGGLKKFGPQWNNVTLNIVQQNNKFYIQDNQDTLYELQGDFQKWNKIRNLYPARLIGSWEKTGDENLIRFSVTNLMRKEETIEAIRAEPEYKASKSAQKTEERAIATPVYPKVKKLVLCAGSGETPVQLTMYEQDEQTAFIVNNTPKKEKFEIKNWKDGEEAPTNPYDINSTITAKKMIKSIKGKTAVNPNNGTEMLINACLLPRMTDETFYKRAVSPFLYTFALLDKNGTPISEGGRLKKITLRLDTRQESDIKDGIDFHTIERKPKPLRKPVFKTLTNDMLYEER